MKILVIGQCSLHWGRMEFGNIGNFYIIEPFFDELKRTFPGAVISTTMQMSQEFCDRENVKVLPLSYYYSWSEKDLENALAELSAAYIYNKTGFLPISTPFIQEVLDSDLVIDFSGDIWGDNANFLGKDRFLVGLCKDRVAQLLKKPVVMIAGSPGPFNQQETLAFAQEVFENFDLVANREPISMGLLKQDGFNVDKVKSLACPAFLFKPKMTNDLKVRMQKEGLLKKEKPTIGYILCGWNFIDGPFDKWPRQDEDYIHFAESVEFITEHLGARVCLMSHSNGFHVPPAPFKYIHGRDFPIAQQLYKVIQDRGIAKDVFLLTEVYDAWETKAIIGNFDMLVSGRIHGAVAGLSQNIPTVIIDYGHEPKAHKLVGFANVANVQEYVADPALKGDIIKKIDSCWRNLKEYKNHLITYIPEVKEKARENFKVLKGIVKS